MLKKYIAPDVHVTPKAIKFIFSLSDFVQNQTKMRNIITFIIYCIIYL